MTKAKNVLYPYNSKSRDSCIKDILQVVKNHSELCIYEQVFCVSIAKSKLLEKVKKP